MPFDPSKPSTYNVQADLSEDPKSNDEATRSSERDLWRAAMQEEIDSPENMQVCTPEALPPGYKILGNKWVFKRKRDASGRVIRRKVRLVVKGYAQREKHRLF